MSTWVKTQRFTAATATGTQDLTIAGMGTPKAVIVIASQSQTEEAAGNHSVICVGMTDGTITKSGCFMSEHGVADTDTFHEFGNSLIQVNTPVGTTNPAAQVVMWQGDFSAWITDGIQINWTTVQPGAILVTVIFFGGTDVSAHVDLVTLSASANGTTAYTAPGFEPDQVFALGHLNTTTWISEATQCVGPYLGVADNGASIVQCFSGHFERDAQAAGVPCRLVEDRYIYLRQTDTSTHNSIGEITSFDANGFTITQRGAAPVATLIAVLCLKYGAGVGHWVGIHSTATATGDQASTAPGFKPQALGFFGSHVEATRTLIDTGDAGSGGISVADDTRQFCVSTQEEDASATTDTQMYADNVLVNLPDHDGGVATDLIGTLSTFDTNGFTLNWTAVDTVAAKKFVAWAVGEAVAPVSLVAPASHPMLHMLMR